MRDRGATSENIHSLLVRALTLSAHGGLEKLEVRDDVPPPELQSPADVRVRVRAAALNHLDLFVVRGMPGITITPKWVLGADACGVVHGLLLSVVPGRRQEGDHVADTADGAINLTPYVQSGRNSFYVYRADMSLAPANQPPAPLTAVTVFVLHPGAGPDFVAAIKKSNDALSKQADWPKTSGWLQLINGGEGPTFVLLSARKNWADFAPLPKNLTDVLTETYGKETADQIQKTIRDSTARQYTEAASYRADLSYVPGK